MRFARPEALWLATLALPVVAFHLLRPRRAPVVVSSTEIWRRVAGSRPVSAADPWQRFRASLLLALQVAAVLLLALAAAGPERIRHPPLGPHTVYVFDESASMGALDGAPDRIGTARERAVDLRRGAPAGSLSSVVAASARPALLLEASPDEAAFERAVDDVTAGEGPADLPAAFAVAVGLSRSDRPVDVVLLTDGALDAAARRLVPAGTREVRVGDRSTNRAITRLAVEEHTGAVLARVTVANLGGPGVTQTLHLDVDGVAAAQVELDLPAGATVERDVELPAGDVVEARLDGEDLLPLDDTAVGVVARRRGLRVLLDGPADTYLDSLLGAIGGATVERPGAGAAPPAPAPGAGPAAAYDLAVYDGVDPPENPGAPVLTIAPPSGYGPVQVTGGIERPAIVSVAADEPVTAGIDLSEVRIAHAQQLGAPGAEILVGGDRGPLLVRGQSAGRAFAYLGFHLADSDLPLQVAFPLLFDRLIDDLAQATRPTSTLQVGEPLPVPPGVEATVDLPGGRRLRLAPGDARPLAETAGLHRIEVTGRPPIALAVNPPAAESDLHGGPDLERTADGPGATAGAPLGPQPSGSRPGTIATPLLAWLAAAVLLVGAAELLSARRHRGVGRSQWWLAVGARAATAGLVVTTLVDPRVTRTARGVATVFVIDASDSVGSSGQADEAAFLQDALARRPPGARTAVVRFGGDARLAAGLGDGHFEPEVVTIDPSRTDLAGALRLGAALLPDDARRRLVLLSDGRRTEGDEDAVVDGLRRRGVAVDVVTTRPRGDLDVAVTALDGPATAHAGEQLTLTATLTATASPSAPVDVLLRRDGEVVATARVAPVPGAALAVPFTDVVPDGAPLRRYQVEAHATGDDVTANDRAYLGVRVEGPARVLVVEGSAGEAAALAGALRAGGIGVDVVSPGALPPLDALGAYAASVLVDVDARGLSAAQLDALTTTVSDLGRGLTVLGGPRAFGPGGYRDTPLEDLLPVVSEINDPKRQRSVAEVLAIDTSGSMGSCHCSGGAQFGMSQNRVFGGVNKTDISRSAAARSIEALRSNDEMGVLAITNESRWVIDLQKLPAQAVVDAGLRSLRPDGGTDLSESLRTSAEALRRSKAQLRHIVLFTDGFTRPKVLSQLAADAAELSQEGITTSVVATGEGADMTALEAVATAGRGRFYAGKDLHDLPQVIVDETVLSSRRFINEGVFTAEPDADTPVVGGLGTAPALLGFVGTSAKPSATTLASVGPEHDPLLATWQAGLGRVTAWTSDASLQWAQQWPEWAGYVGFWTTVVKDTFREGATEGGLDVRFEGDELSVQADATTAWPDETAATVRMTAPDGSVEEARLERVDAVTFRGDVPASQPGTYALGVQVSPPGGGGVTLSGTANRPYGEEYQPGQPDTARLTRLAALTGGRVDIAAATAFDPGDLPPGRRTVPLGPVLIVAAALAWVLGVALSRLVLGDARRLRRAPHAVFRHAGDLSRRAAGMTRAGRPLRRDRRPEEDGP